MKRWTAPKGSRLAILRLRGHHFLDARWKYDGETRTQAYQWLADQLQTPLKDCHFGAFDEAQCEAALTVLNAWYFGEYPKPDSVARNTAL